jgi:hypothetical protein
MTPYDIIFGEEFETGLFPALTADAETNSADTRDVEEFLQLPAATDLMEKLSPRGSADPPPVTGVAALAFHGYHFWRHGRRVDALDETALRSLTSGDVPVGEWTMEAPAVAGYVSLPQNILWAQPGEGAAEPVHGFFYTVSPTTVDGARLALLLALGVRAERPGFTAIELGVPLPAPPPGHFGDIIARDGSPDFANVLPGGELKNFLSVTNAGEVLKLVSRIFHALAA